MIWKDFLLFICWYDLGGFLIIHRLIWLTMFSSLNFFIKDVAKMRYPIIDISSHCNYIYKCFNLYYWDTMNKNHLFLSSWFFLFRVFHAYHCVPLPFTLTFHGLCLVTFWFLKALVCPFLVRGKSFCLTTLHDICWEFEKSMTKNFEGSSKPFSKFIEAISFEVTSWAMASLEFKGLSFSNITRNSYSSIFYVA